MTFTLSEAQVPGHCQEHDTEDPVCARAVFMGLLTQLDDQDDAVREMIFAKHPAMRTWHAHSYHAYELVVDKIRVLDFYGGYGWPRVEDYYTWSAGM